jgi:AraC-like DNA-binding protein
MDVKRASPRPELRSVLRSFVEMRADLGSAGHTWPVAARPHQMLHFHLAEPYRVSFDDGPASAWPQTYVSGPQTYQRAQIYESDQIHVLNILFQPTGLNRLTGINMASLVNEAPPASDVLGRSALALDDAVRAAPNFHSRVAAVERWVAMMLEKREGDAAIGRASRLLMAAQGGARIDNLVRRSGLSASQFQRRFATEVGLTPKLFARTIRFDGALAARREAPDRSWTDIVHEFGYFDQAHFIGECHAFARLPPSGLVGDWENTRFPAR